MKPLWTFADLAAALGDAATLDPEPPAGAAITGVSIDTRTLSRGDVFVALEDVRDGHDFVPAAFKAGAAAALVRTNYQRAEGDGVLIRVADPLAALVTLGQAARARLSPEARVTAVTGSAGKTSTKEMLRACLSAVVPGRVHASEKSYNNHWGVPLTLARMPADTAQAVFEIGMNHAGEITPLSRMVRPHAAIITTVEAVHLEHFASVSDIARAKAEIFAGLVPGGSAILPGDNPHVAILAAAAEVAGARIVSFGSPGVVPGRVNTLDVVSVEAAAATAAAQTVRVKVHPPCSEGEPVVRQFDLGLPGTHMAMNAAAVLLALDAVGIALRSRPPDGAPVDRAIAALASLSPGAGRGERTMLDVPGGKVLVIDESYNANPASMAAALATMALTPRATYPRRIAVLGDMLELGPESPALHEGLKVTLATTGADLLFAAGPMMRHLFDAVPEPRRGSWASTADGIKAALLDAVKAGDVVLIKGSNGSRMAPLVAALKSRHTFVASDS